MVVRSSKPFKNSIQQSWYQRTLILMRTLMVNDDICGRQAKAGRSRLFWESKASHPSLSDPLGSNYRIF